ncbi:MAG: hypothetical protein HRU19_06395 [Pseudobacteriovorax sp.]|nr:hypothetical protein [Pseudobacteriovorax sp.]
MQGKIIASIVLLVACLAIWFTSRPPSNQNAKKPLPSDPGPVSSSQMESSSNDEGKNLKTNTFSEPSRAEPKAMTKPNIERARTKTLSKTKEGLKTTVADQNESTAIRWKALRELEVKHPDSLPGVIEKLPASDPLRRLVESIRQVREHSESQGLKE